MANEATVIAAWVAEFRRAREQIDKALTQLSDDQFRTRLTPTTNSCALIVKHLAGNMRSRWTDWLSTDGEKPDRNRESEFEDRGESRAELMQRLDHGWSLVFGALAALTPPDLARTVRIRGQAHTLPEAVERQVAHYGYHAGQIQLIARIIHGEEGWQWQSIPHGGSAKFNQQMAASFGQFGSPAGGAKPS
jgi:uncharacterized damage-inducible protein DinB